jgi:hypothetical protein
MHEDLLAKLGQRLGPVHAKQRLGIETDHEAQAFCHGLTFFHIENWYSVIRNTLKLAGLYGRGRRNAERVVVRHNDIRFKGLPPIFDDFTILHISDMHADMNETAMRNLVGLAAQNINAGKLVLSHTTICGYDRNSTYRD